MDSEQAPPESSTETYSSRIPWSELLSVIALVLSAVSFIAGHRLAARSAVIAVRPVLVFEYSGDAGWSLRNVGNGPALDVIVQHRWETGNWSGPVRVPPLAPGGTFATAWIGHADVRGLGSSYADIEARPYSSTTVDDLTSTHEGNVLPQWPESSVRKHWNAEPLTQ
jgi:hypothetical protein